MAGVTGTINPSGDLNPGNVSIDGQRESANGFTVNGIDVQEGMNGGTSVIPNLDSIQEFRVLTNNFDTEYGNYNGGMVNVVTRSGSNQFHGSAFEFLRNTDLDARNFFAPRGAVSTEPAWRHDWRSHPEKQSVLLPGLSGHPDHGRHFVSGEHGPVQPGTRRQLYGCGKPVERHRGWGIPSEPIAIKLNYGVSAGEPFYTSGCTSNSQCVFPGAIIPQSVWSPVAQNLLKYIPAANIGSNLFSTSNYPETVRDDKAGGRIDANTRAGTIFGYYFVDNYRLDNPYPGGQGGATIPGSTP